MGRPRIGFIGAGVVGTAIASRLFEAGYPIVSVYSRTKARAVRLAERIGADVPDDPQGVVDVAEVVFLTVPDDAIEEVAGSLSWSAGKSAVHCSGSRSLEPLSEVARAGGSVGVLHPLQAFATAEQAEKNLKGSAFAIEASDGDLRSELERIARSLGGRPFFLAGEKKALYHASATIASNYLVTLLDLASSLWERFGSTKEDGLRSLLPLVKGTVENLKEVGLPDALTGPISRGDVGTIRRHIEALSEVAPELAAVYKELARVTIPIALAKGRIDGEAARAIERALEE